MNNEQIWKSFFRCHGVCMRVLIMPARRIDGKYRSDNYEWQQQCNRNRSWAGGFDQGKVGINGAFEKEINLSISFKLKKALEKEGYEIVLTRTTDTGLNTATDKSKKSADMRNRVKVINDTKPLLAISIHQNSYPSESVKGAQVFYYKASAEGKKLAEIIQDSMKSLLDNNNKRVAKDNSNYYMLTHTQCPTVIVECGFLSNQQEARMLLDDAYQEKVAIAITNGVKDYVKQK